MAGHFKAAARYFFRARPR